MKHTPIIRLVISQVNPEIEKEWIRWFNDTHIPMLLKFKWLRGAASYKLTSETEPSGYSEYMLILEFDNQEGFEAYQASPEHVAATEEAHTHDWSGLQSVNRRVQYELVKSWSENRQR